MRIEIKTGKGNFRRWHNVLADRLKTYVSGSQIRFVSGAPERPLPGTVATLLELERLVFRKTRPSIWDLAPEPVPNQDTSGQADIILDCRGDVANDPSTAPLVVRPLFDGYPGYQAMMGALLQRRLPEIAIEDIKTGIILAKGYPSGEAAEGLRGGAEAVLSRVIALLVRVLTSPQDSLQNTGRKDASIQSISVIRYGASDLVQSAIRAIYRLCFFSPHWRVGWRFVEGPGVIETGDLSGPKWRILKCPSTSFCADPFPITWQGKSCIFFEQFDHRVGKGIIAGIDVGSGGPEGDIFPVIEEETHLSYPFLIEEDGQLWMVPENSLSGAVPIYRCVEFPRKWQRHGTLIEGIEAADCTIFKHGGLFWMTSVVREGLGGFSDTLAIHYANGLFGPWKEHNLRPVLIDVAKARPAGNIVSQNGHLLRPLQDCSRGYGHSLGITRIDRLTPDEFSQSLVATVHSGPLWPGGRLHTLNRSGNLECIDGTIYNPKLGILRSYFGTQNDP